MPWRCIEGVGIAPHILDHASFKLKVIRYVKEANSSAILRKSSISMAMYTDVMEGWRTVAVPT